MTVKRNRPRRETQTCITCKHCVPVGEGDHICDIANPERALVIEDYDPTEDHKWCNGKEWADQ